MTVRFNSQLIYLLPVDFVTADKRGVTTRAGP